MSNANYLGPPVITQPGYGPTLGAYSSGDANYYGIPGQQAYLARQQAARSYALQRFAQMRRVMGLLSPDLQGQIRSGLSASDPAAAWRAYSAAFAQASRAAGYADPRYYLTYVLPEQLRAQRAQAANSMRGGV